MKRKTFVWIVVLAGLVYVFSPVVAKIYKLDHQTTDLEADIQRLSAQRQLLESEFMLLEKDPVYVERVARKLLHKAREGEVIYRFVPQEELEETAHSG